MPIVHLRGGEVDRADASAVLTALARAVADAVPCDVDGVWCTFTAVDHQTIGERTSTDEGRIVYLDLWIRPRETDPEGATRALEAACRAAAGGLDLPLEDVWGTLRHVEAGRVFAGGSLIVDPGQSGHRDRPAN